MTHELLPLATQRPAGPTRTERDEHFVLESGLLTRRGSLGADAELDLGYHRRAGRQPRR